MNEGVAEHDPVPGLVEPPFLIAQRATQQRHVIHQLLAYLQDLELLIAVAVTTVANERAVERRHATVQVVVAHYLPHPPSLRVFPEVTPLAHRRFFLIFYLGTDIGGDLNFRPEREGDEI